MVLLTVRVLSRIQELEQAAGSREPAQHADPSSLSARRPAIPGEAPIIVCGVDVAPLATAADIVGVVESATSEEWAAEGAALRASLRMARVLVQETFEELQAASARSAS
jgi:hypothetical protein